MSSIVSSETESSSLATAAGDMPDYNYNMRNLGTREERMALAQTPDFIEAIVRRMNVKQATKPTNSLLTLLSRAERALPVVREEADRLREEGRFGEEDDPGLEDRERRGSEVPWDELIMSDRFVEYLEAYVTWLLGSVRFRQMAEQPQRRRQEFAQMEDRRTVCTWDEAEELERLQQYCSEFHELRAEERGRGSSASRAGSPSRSRSRSPRHRNESPGRRDEAGGRTQTVRMQAKLTAIAKPLAKGATQVEKELFQFNLWQRTEQWLAQPRADLTQQNVMEALRNNDELTAFFQTWAMRNRRQAWWQAQRQDEEMEAERVSRFIDHLKEQKANPQDFVRSLIAQVKAMTQASEGIPVVNFFSIIKDRMEQAEAVAAETGYTIEAWTPSSETNKAEFIKSRLLPALSKELVERRRQTTLERTGVAEEEYTSIEQLEKWAKISAAADPKRFEASAPPSTAADNRRQARVAALEGEADQQQAAGGGAPAEGDEPKPSKSERKRLKKVEAELKAAQQAAAQRRDGSGGWKFDAAAGAHNFLPGAFKYGEGLIPPRRGKGDKLICARFYNRHHSHCPACESKVCGRFDHQLTIEEEAYRKSQMEAEAAGQPVPTEMPGRRMGDMHTQAAMSTEAAPVPSSLESRMKQLEGITGNLASSLVNLDATLKQAGRQAASASKPTEQSSGSRSERRIRQLEAELAKVRAQGEDGESEDLIMFSPDWTRRSDGLVGSVVGGLARKLQALITRVSPSEATLATRGEATADLLFGDFEPEEMGWWQSAETRAHGGAALIDSPTIRRMVFEPTSNPHLELTLSDGKGNSSQLIAMLDSGAHLQGAIGKSTANLLAKRLPGLISKVVKFATPVNVTGIDKKQRGQGARIVGRLTLGENGGLLLDGVPQVVKDISIIEGANMSRCDLILGNKHFAADSAVLDFSEGVYVTKPNDIARRVKAPMLYYNGSGELVHRLNVGSELGEGRPIDVAEAAAIEEAAWIAGDARSRAKPGNEAENPTPVQQSAQTARTCKSEGLDRLNQQTSPEAHAYRERELIEHAMELKRLDRRLVREELLTSAKKEQRRCSEASRSGEYEHAWAPKIVRKVFPLLLCLTTAALSLAPGETKTAQCELRVARHALPAVDFTIMEKPFFTGLETVQHGLFRTELSGAVRLPITNNSTTGYVLEPGDELFQAVWAERLLDLTRATGRTDGTVDEQHDELATALQTLTTREQEVIDEFKQQVGAGFTRRGGASRASATHPLRGERDIGKDTANLLAQRLTDAFDTSSVSSYAVAARAPLEQSQPHGCMLPQRQAASLEDILAQNTCILSIDPAVWEREDVIPVVILYSGMGGLTMALNTPKDGMHYVVALAVDMEAEALAAHRVNSPQVPTVQHLIEDRRALELLVEKFLPKQHWSKAWMHASPSCKEATTANRQRSINLAIEQTSRTVAMLQHFAPAVWTVEQASALAHAFSGLYPTARTVQMRDHAALPSERLRLIMSNKELHLPISEAPSVTPHDVLASECGWGEELRFSRQSYGSIRSTRQPGFTVTSGMHHVGSKTVGDMNASHVPSASMRAKLIGFDLEKLPKFPAHMPETRRRQLVSEVVPPLFAAALRSSVHSSLTLARASTQFHSNIARVAEMGEAHAELLAVEMGLLQPQHASEPQVLPEKPLATRGDWSYWGPDLGWALVSQPIVDLATKLRLQPYARLDHPPPQGVNLSEWWSARADYLRQAAAEMEERFDMSAQDGRPHDASPKRPAARNGTFVNVHDKPTEKASFNSNEALQRSDPTWYGPYLDEGRKYHTERSQANFNKVCKVLGLEDLPDDCKSVQQELKDMIYDHWLIFDGEMREVKGVKVDLDMGHVKPIRVHPYRWSPAKTAIAKGLIEEFVQDGILSLTNSPWGFGAVLAPKPNGGWRLCIDLRPLNALLPRDNFEPPSCDLCLSWLAGRPYRTTLDCRWGFYQVGLTERAKQVLCLNTSLGTYCFNRLVMGHLNATAEFQRHVNYTLGDSLWKEALAMVDDVIVATATLTEHIDALRRVLGKLAERHHSVKPEKMHILRKLLEYLGHISTPEGTLISDKHKEAITAMPYPVDASGNVNRTSVRSYLGSVKYSRRYIKDCAKLCGPLNDLTSDAFPMEWSPLCAACWDLLKYYISENKGVWHIDYKYPIYVSSDGSKGGIGGYIWQKVNGEERVVSYFSRKTTPDERKWDTREIEVLALISTLEHFHALLDGHEFTALTDHRNTQWLLQQKQLSGRLGRWVLRLSDYKMRLQYQEGKLMEVADCLSRNAASQTTEVMIVELAKGLYEIALPEDAAEGEGGVFASEVDSPAMPPLNNFSGALAPTKVSLDRIREAQREDSWCQSLRRRLQGQDAWMARQYAELDGVLHHWAPGPNSASVEQARICVPKELRAQLLHNFHNSIYGCHRGEKATREDLAARFYWPQLKEDVREHVRNCRECQLAKGGAPSRQGHLYGQRHLGVMHQLCMDLIGPISVGKARHGDDVPTYVLTIVDPFSHMVWLEVINKKSAAQVYQRFCERILLEEGTPRVVLTDNGGEFKNELLRGLMEYAKITHNFTPLYHSRSNYAERVNRWVGEQLRALTNAPGARKIDWPNMIKPIEFAYRRAKIPGTNFSPFEVSRGRQPLLPTDISEIDNDYPGPALPLAEHVEQLKKRMELAELLVGQAREQVRAKNKEAFDASQFTERFEPGDLVRWFHQMPAVRDAATGLLDASKLKLRNAVWRVFERRGQTYTLRNEMTGALATAHLDQLARYHTPKVDKGADASEQAAPVGNRTPESAPADRTAELPSDSEEVQSQMRKQLEVGKYLVFHDKDYPKHIVHVAEVLDIEEDSIKVWYLWDVAQADNIQAGRSLKARPLSLWVSAPEWYNRRTNKGVKVERGDDPVEKGLSRRVSTLLHEEIEIIVPKFDAQRRVGGGFLPALTRQVDAWLRRQPITIRKLLSVLSEATAADRGEV